MGEQNIDDIVTRLGKLEDMVCDLTTLLRGDSDNLGLVGRVARHHLSLYGNDQEFGVIHKVNVVWKTYIWLLCTGSAAAGMFAMWMIERIARM